MKMMNGLKNLNRKKPVTETASIKSALADNGHAGSKTVTIEAKIDVGFGNTLYLRGEGRGLSWNQGIPLTCVDSSTWQWSGEAADRLKFKLLINDAIWA